MSNKSNRKPTLVTLGLIFFISLPAAAADPVIHNGIDLWVTGDDARRFSNSPRIPFPRASFAAAPLLLPAG